VSCQPPAARAGAQDGCPSLLRLVDVMDTLRTACPWDAKQTHTSLAPHLVEECYEALDALESGDPAALRDELGDVLLQVYFHARIASESTDGTGFTIDDVAAGTVDKLTRRHPHVFGGAEVSGADEVKRNWDAIKVAERAAAGLPAASAVDSVPFGQPALALAAQLQARAERAGAPARLADLSDAVTPSSAVTPSDAVTASGVPGDEGHAGAGGAAGGGGSGEVSDLGAELFALVARARRAGLDPELELRAAARVFAGRVRAWELPGAP